MYKTCNETKNINEFVKDKNQRDGYRSRCKNCENLRRRKTPLKPKPKEGHKFCASCGQEKILDEFNVRLNAGKYRPFSYCKSCERKKISQDIVMSAKYAKNVINPVGKIIRFALIVMLPISLKQIKTPVFFLQLTLVERTTQCMINKGLEKRILIIILTRRTKKEILVV